MLSPPLGAATLPAALLGAVRRYHSRHPRFEDIVRSYRDRDLLKTTLAFYRLLAPLTQRGETVGILLPNILAALALLIALTALGRLPALLNPTVGRDGLLHACHLAGIRRILTSDQFLVKANLTSLILSLPGIEVTSLETLRQRWRFADTLWLILAFLHPERWLAPDPPNAIDPESPAVILFTSGSESQPKGVLLSHRALLANVAQILAVHPFGPQDAIFNPLPLFHAFGLTVGTLLPLLSGARLVLYPTPLHYKEIPRLIGEKRCNTLFSTNTFLRHYGEAADPADLTSLTYVVAGAEKLTEPVRQLWRERFSIDILEGYGCTEMAPVVAVNLPGDNCPGTVGRLLPGIEAQILPVPGIAEGGELHLKGPNLMLGYYRVQAPQQLDPPSSALGPGWYATGDLAQFTPDGRLSILGRLSRFAKIAGERISLDLSETIARAASPAAQHAALALPDDERGEAILLVTTDPELTRERLIAAARAHGYSELALPRRLIYLPELPLLPTGKIDYPTLAARLRSSPPIPPNGESPLSPLPTG